MEIARVKKNLNHVDTKVTKNQAADPKLKEIADAEMEKNHLPVNKPDEMEYLMRFKDGLNHVDTKVTKNLAADPGLKKIAEEGEMEQRRKEMSKPKKLAQIDVSETEEEEIARIKRNLKRVDTKVTKNHVADPGLKAISEVDVVSKKIRGEDPWA